MTTGEAGPRADGPQASDGLGSTTSAGSRATHEVPAATASRAQPGEPTASRAQPAEPERRGHAGEPAAVDPRLMAGIGRGRPALFASIWLLYLFAPLADALRAHGPWRAVAVVALIGFAGLFVLGSLMVRGIRRGEQAATRMWLVLLAMAGLLVLAAPAAGTDVVGAVIYIAVLAVMGLPGRAAVVVVVGVALAAELIPRLVPGWTTDAFFAFQVLIASLAAWGVIQVIARNAELISAREEIARLAVADERARVARDLHDILGHSLTVITVKAELAGRLAETEGAGATGAEIADVERLAREALADVRATIGGMRGITLAGELAGARTALEAAGIKATLPSSVDDVPPAWRDLFAWTVREGVTNVVRHSSAGRCVVRLGPHSVEVEDDGCGPQPAATSHGVGNGLLGLAERARHAGAHMSVGTARTRGGGFVLRVEVPA